MRKVLMATAAAAAMAMADSASAGTYIPVPMVPGAVSEIAFSINNKNIVAGSYRDSADVEHGFFGPLDGSNWTTFDAPFDGTTGTEPRYIGDDGSITGIALNPNFKVGEEFYRAPDGTFTVFTKDGVPLDGIAQGINDSEVSMGDYFNTPEGRWVGYIGQSGKYLKDFRLHLNGSKHMLQISPRGITNPGVVTVGFFTDEAGHQHGFIQENIGKRDKPVFIIDHPNATRTALEDTSDSLIASGQWIDSDNNPHAFKVKFNKLQMKMTDLNPGDGSSYQQAWGINDDGLIAVSTSAGHSYIYCPKKDPQKCPAAGVVVDERAISVWATKHLLRCHDSKAPHHTSSEPHDWERFNNLACTRRFERGILYLKKGAIS